MKKKPVDNPEVRQHLADGWISILREGSFTDSAGNEHTFTADRLDKIVSNYDPSHEEAPLVIGHPKTNAPAWGWAESLKHVGEMLLAKPKQVVAAFSEAVRAGQYKKISVKIVDNHLKHIGFLGAALPAVPGLGTATLSAEEDGYSIELMATCCDPSDPDWDLAWKIVAAGNILSRLRDHLIEKEGVEVADKIIPSWDINNLIQAPTPTPSSNPGFSQEDRVNLQEATQKITELEGDKTRLSAELSAKADEVTLLTGQLAARDTAAWEEHRGAFCQKLEAKGLILPADRAAIESMLDDARAKGAGEFSQGKNVKLEEVKTFLLNQAPKLSLEEIARKGRAEGGDETPAEEYSAPVNQESLIIHKKALQIAKDENIPYAQAALKASGTRA